MNALWGVGLFVSVLCTTSVGAGEENIWDALRRDPRVHEEVRRRQEQRWREFDQHREHEQRQQRWQELTRSLRRQERQKQCGTKP